MPSKSSKRKQTLPETFYSLTDSQKSIVQVFALLYEPTNRTLAHQCWLDGTCKDIAIESAAQADGVFLEKYFSERLKLLGAKPFSQTVTQLVKKGVLMQQQTQGPRCHPDLLEIACREAVRTDKFEPLAQAIEAVLPVPKYFRSDTRNFRRPGEFVRSLRLAIYRQDNLEIDDLYAAISHVAWRSDMAFFDTLREILTNPFDPDWMRGLSEPFCEMGLSAILGNSIERCVPALDAFELLKAIYTEQEIAKQEIDRENSEAESDFSTELALLYAEQLWMRGSIAQASQVVAAVEQNDDLPDYAHQYHALLGAIAFLSGDTDTAIAQYHLGLLAAGTEPDEQTAWFTLPAAALFFLALLKEGSPASQQELAQFGRLIQTQPDHWLFESTSLLLSVSKMQQGSFSDVLDTIEGLKEYRIRSTGIPALLQSCSLYWLSVEHLSEWLPDQLAHLCQTALKAGYGWIALEAADLLIHYRPEDSLHMEIAAALREQAATVPLIESIQPKAPWELSLSALSQLTEALTEADNSVEYGSFRLAWRLQFISAQSWSLTPLEQKIGVKGSWTKGKPIALKRLTDDYEIPDYATAQDRRICETIEVKYEQSSYYYSASSPVYFFTNRTLVELVGHPLVFWEDSPSVRVDLVKGEPELIVKRLEGGDRITLSLMPPLQDTDLLIERETPTRLKVIPVTADHRRIAALLGANNQLAVPVQAEAQVLQAIASVASLVTVQSDIGGGVEAESVPADATPRMHLLPAGAGLKASLLVHPFSEGGSYYRPGEGGETVIAEVEGKRLQTQRNLTTEKASAQAVIDACPILDDYDEESEATGEWLIEATEDSLELLLQLQALGDEIIIEWPEGEKFRLSRQLGLSDFKFDVRKENDWFAASGEVQISEDRVMDLQQLMALLDSSPGQFVALADGEFLALTDEFRQRLKTLDRLSQRQGKDLRIHGLAALALDEMMSDVEQLAVDQAWQTHIQKIKAACAIEPEVPDTLNAQLRDYQETGYTWLARLANWGVGACLADDMGLGKTLQGLALILSRCSEGPTLVIAPTSVCMNWVSEAARFAPSLQVKEFGAVNREDRQRLLDGLGANDLVVGSYGLLQQEDMAEMLQGVTWQNIVLDEAQAIKNYATKRSQAVMALSGSFKIIMTGTPIENHLGELWNLFRFINPGLLGSLESFNQRFANPIERDRNDAASDALRRLIQPFILRRTKDQVLKELPSRTEILLPVELSTEERAFYEALRREALVKLSESDAQAGQKHLQVLAEIMRLRRACCNPSLVRPELAIPSTKLEQFSELISELLENGHKALVFSQFVDHLKILRAHLESQQISYQYLDGSTPAKKRKQAVDAFQDGKGDVFLISLKAGGSGLNLTAADYVLHMDPWWNPAVEDQASDRAHRIGQQRPVTIYRLVAKGTIEDKIVGLHQVKRDLADSLLTGADMSSKVSTDELLSLIQQ